MPAGKTIDDMPNEILIHILAYVDNEFSSDLHSATLVCSKWKQLATPMLYRAPLLNRTPQLRALTETLESNSIKASCVQSISLGAMISRRVDDDDVVRLLNACKQSLRQLNITAGPKLSPQLFTKLSTEFRLLEKFSVIDDIMRPRFNSHALSVTFMNCSSLVDVILMDCDYLDDASITALAKNCTQLRKLVIINTGKVTDKSVDTLRLNADRLRTIYLTSKTLTESQSLIQLARRCRKVYICVNSSETPSQIDGMMIAKQSRLTKNVSAEELQIERAQFLQQANRLF